MLNLCICFVCETLHLNEVDGEVANFVPHVQYNVYLQKSKRLGKLSEIEGEQFRSLSKWLSSKSEVVVNPILNKW